MSIIFLFQEHLPFFAILSIFSHITLFYILEYMISKIEIIKKVDKRLYIFLIKSFSFSILHLSCIWRKAWADINNI